MKKLFFLIAIVAMALSVQGVFAQDISAATENITITQLEDGRFVGSDGYEYFYEGSGGDFDEDDAFTVGLSACPVKTASDKVGKAEVCDSWSGSTLSVKIKLIAPSNAYGQACYVKAGTNDILDCGTGLAPAGSWASATFYGLAQGSHAGGFQYYFQGAKVND